jgi:hypothetical protein
MINDSATCGFWQLTHPRFDPPRRGWLESEEQAEGLDVEERTSRDQVAAGRTDVQA